MRVTLLAIACVSGWSVPALCAADGSSDSYCEWSNPVSGVMVWHVDSKLTAYMNREVNEVPAGFGNDDMRGLVEMALQNLARHSRAQIFARVFSADDVCDPFNGPGCVTALTDAEDWWGCGFSQTVAYTSAATKSIVFCTDHGGVAEKVTETLEHELGHAYGLLHVESESGSSCNSTAGCATTSDGCEGETMCRSTCTGVGTGYASGDTAGLRKVRFGDSDRRNRAWNTGSTPIPGLPASVTFKTPALSGVLSSYQPRIDCARGVGATNTCAVVRSFFSGGNDNLRITKLNGWNSLTGWTSVVATQSWTMSIDYAPDISLSDDGSIAWVARASAGSSNNVQVRRIVLGTESTASVSLGYKTRFAPRISYYGGDTALIIGVESKVSPEPNRWRLHRVQVSGGSLTATGINFGELDDRNGVLDNQDVDQNVIAADFDFDCERADNGLCILSTVLWDRNTDNSTVNHVQRRRFRVSGAGSTATLLESDWQRDTNYTAQSVISVAYKPADRLYVSSGRSLYGSANENNTRLVEYSNSTSLTPLDTLLHKSDCVTCLQHTSPSGEIVPAATTHGGESIAFCPTCNAGAGTLESVHLGLTEAGNAYCY